MGVIMAAQYEECGGIEMKSWLTVEEMTVLLQNTLGTI